MSMDKSAIEQIQASEALVIANNELAKQSVPGLLISNDNQGLVDLERFMPVKRHFSLGFSTRIIEEFERYILENANADSGIFINDERLTAQCIIDLGAADKPLHKMHTSELTLKRTACFSAMKRIDGTRIAQKDAAEFIEDWKEEIHSITTQSGEAMTLGQAAAAMRNVTIEQAREVNSKVDDFGYQASAQERLEAKNKDKLPAFLTFAVVPYHGLKLRHIVFRLGISTSSDTPAISFKMMGAEALEEELAREFKELLELGLKDSAATISIGTI